MRTRINRYFLLSLALTAAVLSGCGGSDSSTSFESGTMSLAVADTPVDGATSVMVTFTGVQIQPGGRGGDDHFGFFGNTFFGTGGMYNFNSMWDDDGTPAAGTITMPPTTTSSAPAGTTNSGGMSHKLLTFTFPTAVQVDLLQQQDDNSATILNGVSLPAGNYAWIRLMVDPSSASITLSDGSVHPLVIPDQSSLILVDGFTVAQGGSVDFTVDFDLRRSIIMADGKYILKPVLRLINDVDVGQIVGSVSNTFMIGSTAVSDPSCMPAAYIYAGANVTPVDINPTSSVQPLITAGLKLDHDSGNYRFRAGLLDPGTYTVALVCASGDNPATSDSLTFSTPMDVTVSSDQTAMVNFQ